MTIDSDVLKLQINLKLFSAFCSTSCKCSVSEMGTIKNEIIGNGKIPVLTIGNSKTAIYEPLWVDVSAFIRIKSKT